MFTTDTCEFFDVLGGFFLENFESIVVGDDSEEVMKFIDDREDDEVVFGKSAGGVFLVGGGEDEFIRVLHDVADGGVPGFEGEVAEADFSDQPALFIDDKNTGEGFRVFAIAAENGDGLFHRHVRGDAADVGGHPSAGGVFFVFEKVFGEFFITWAEEGKEADLGFFGNDLEDIDAVVVGEVAEEEAELGGFEMIESVLDQGVWEFRNDIGGEFGSDGFHEEIPFLIIEVLIEFREVGVVGVMSRSEESRSILGIDGAFDQIDRFHVLYVRHGRSLGECGWLVNAEMWKRDQRPDKKF